MTRPVTLSEPHFSQHTLNKYASLMAQGNGYLGLRASHEEDYTRQTRGMYLAGLYHRAGKGEINELVNLPDVVGMEIAINGEVFSLSHEAWQRELDFASGELRRNVVWRTSNGSGYTIASRRFVSADQLPLIALEITITPLDADASVLISTGIDASFLWMLQEVGRNSAARTFQAGEATRCPTRLKRLVCRPASRSTPVFAASASHLREAARRYVAVNGALWRYSIAAHHRSPYSNS